MDLEKRIKEIKVNNAFVECFKKGHFSICPINEIHSGYPNRDILSIAHCMNLCDFSEEELIELKRLALEAINWVEPIATIKEKSFWRIWK